MKTTSASGRTSVDVSMERETGAFTVVVSRDGRVAHTFSLNRELELSNKE